MRRRLLIIVFAVASLALAGSIALASKGDDGSKRSREQPTRAELYRLQDRIGKRVDALARQGIYVMSTGHPAEPCVATELANPTRPNIEYLRREFGPHICVRRKPGGQLSACTGYTQPQLPTGSVRVPDLRDLGLREATRRALASGLTHSLKCLGQQDTRAERPRRYSPEQLVRITKQCPAAGEMVAPGTAVVLEGIAILPGGFEYRVGALPYYKDVKPCADGRHVLPPGTGI